MGDIITRIIFTKENASDYVIVHTGDVVEDATRDGSYEEQGKRTKFDAASCLKSHENNRLRSFC